MPRLLHQCDEPPPAPQASDLAAEELEGADVLFRFHGHRNRRTVQSCNFFGPRSEYLMCGSEDAHLWIYSLDTGKAENVLPADVTGIVNCMIAHPVHPVLVSCGTACLVAFRVTPCGGAHGAPAASPLPGLDSEFKVWLPNFDIVRSEASVAAQVAEVEVGFPPPLLFLRPPAVCTPTQAYPRASRPTMMWMRRRRSMRAWRC